MTPGRQAPPRQLAYRGPAITSDPGPGYYRRRVVRDGPYVPVRIWWNGNRDEHGALVEDEVLRCTVGFDERDPYQIWPCGEAITEADYRQMMAVAEWARGTTAPEGNPDKPVDLIDQPPVF